jgi:acetyltransferase-like isoleucine patch superfamily enzyme
VSLYERLCNRLVLALNRWLLHHGAVRPGTSRGNEFGTLGSGTWISHPIGPQYGLGSVHIGKDCLIGQYTVLTVGYGPDDPNIPARGLVIGDRCVIGARTILTSHGSISIGDDVWFGQSIFVSDASHGYQDPETPIGDQLDDHQPVSIGSGTWIGHGAVILPGAQIGRQVVIGAGSVVRGVIPDHSIAVGVPAKVVRRLKPGVGWVATNGSGDIKPVRTRDQVAARMAGELWPADDGD